MSSPAPNESPASRYLRLKQELRELLRRIDEIDQELQELEEAGHSDEETGEEA